ncbi:MAG: RluA family pseudouridine synthase [Candidatus Bipolaricaulota bacterium]|nr:RluA family pseudouridine synthase [Candidatus Bipolaricaulota bacterium]MDW8152015.1 RluA family pseudouridine synthase [Candidatus Bipolaricaulota bacterium]
MRTENESRLDQFSVGEAEAGDRLDRVLARRLGVSRAQARALIHAGQARLGGKRAQPDTRVAAGDVIEVRWEGPGLRPTPFPLPILYEDEAVVVVNKPRGLPVHPAGRIRGPTVVTALLARGPLAGGDPQRPGVVHRLDAPVTGALVLARTEEAYAALVRQFQERRVKKEYLAVVEGEVEVEAGAIEGRVGRDPHAPWRMGLQPGGKAARTEFQVLARAQGRSLLLVRPITGRTHQIRLHLGAIGHPVVGDPFYGRGTGPLLLHAWRLGFFHPRDGAWREFEAPPPEEFGPWLGGRGSS